MSCTPPLRHRHKLLESLLLLTKPAVVKRRVAVRLLRKDILPPTPDW